MNQFFGCNVVKMDKVARESSNSLKAPTRREIFEKVKHGLVARHQEISIVPNFSTATENVCSSYGLSNLLENPRPLNMIEILQRNKFEKAH